jgi:hypothetical protein
VIDLTRVQPDTGFGIRENVIDSITVGNCRSDMNTDIDESDCIVIQQEGSEVRKRDVGLAGSKDPADGDASTPSPEVGEGAVGGRGG